MLSLACVATFFCGLDSLVVIPRCRELISPLPILSLSLSDLKFLGSGWPQRCGSLVCVAMSIPYAGGSYDIRSVCAVMEQSDVFHRVSVECCSP